MKALIALTLILLSTPDSRADDTPATEPYSPAMSGSLEGPSEEFNEGEYQDALSRLDSVKVSMAFAQMLDERLPVILEKSRPEAQSFELLSELLRSLQSYGAKARGSWSSADLKRAIALLRRDERIDDVIVALLKFELSRSVVVKKKGGEAILARASNEHHPLTLSRYLSRRNQILAGSAPRPRPAAVALPRKHCSQPVRAGEAYANPAEGEAPAMTVDQEGSPRLRLYAAYNALQIRSLSRLMETAMARIQASSARIVFETENGPDSFELSPTDQFKASLRIFESMFNQLKLTPIFAGKRPVYADVLAAALETGAVPAELVESASRFEGLGDPRQSKWVKALGLARKMVPTSALSAVIPGYALVALLMVESFYENRNRAPGHPDRIFK